MSDQSLTGESDASRTDAKPSPIPTAESDLAARLREIMGEEPLATFARRAEVGETTLRKYLAGAEPSTSRLVTLADAGGVNIAWLAAGRGPKKGVAAPAPSRPPVVFNDIPRLQATVAAVEEGLQSIGRKLPPDKYAELVAAAYNLMGESSPHSAGVVQFIKAAA